MPLLLALLSGELRFVDYSVDDNQTNSVVSSVNRNALYRSHFSRLLHLTRDGGGNRYGDIYPQTELGKGLAIIYIPIAVVFVSTQLSEVGPKLFGGSSADTLANLLKVRGKRKTCCVVYWTRKHFDIFALCVFAAAVFFFICSLLECTESTITAFLYVFRVVLVSCVRVRT